MIETKIENERVEHLSEQQLGEEWIRSIKEGTLDRLEKFCHPKILSRLLLPAGLVTVHNAADLIAEYRAWFGDCTDFKVEASRVRRIGERLGISYRFLLQDHREWYRIEQQLYCILKDGHVAQLHLLCSGFQLVGTEDQAAPVDAVQAGEQDPVRDGLLEFYAEASDTGSTCALLTPMIKSKLGEMNSGQVLEVRVDDPSAKGDIEAWSRLSGNTLLKMIEDEQQALRFFIKKK